MLVMRRMQTLIPTPAPLRCLPYVIHRERGCDHLANLSQISISFFFLRYLYLFFFQSEGKGWGIEDNPHDGRGLLLTILRVTPSTTGEKVGMWYQG